MKTLLAFTTVALAAAAFAVPEGGPGRGPMPNGPQGGMDGPSDPIVRMVTNQKMAEKIGLTEEQQKKIKAINKEDRNNLGDLRRTFRNAMEKQSELLQADKIDEAAVMAEIDKAFEARKEIAKRQTKRIIAIKSVLTPEQVEKALEAFKSQKRNRRGAEAKAGEGPKGPKPECGEKPPCDGPKCEGGDKPCDGPKGKCKGNRKGGKGQGCPPEGGDDRPPEGGDDCPPEDDEV